MRRWITFGTGVLVGAVLIYLIMNFHVVRAKDGFHVLPKVNAQFASTYVDIRSFTVADWAANAEIAAAIVNAQRRDLLDSAINDTFQSGVDRLLNRETR